MSTLVKNEFILSIDSWIHYLLIRWNHLNFKTKIGKTRMSQWPFYVTCHIRMLAYTYIIYTVPTTLHEEHEGLIGSWIVLQWLWVMEFSFISVSFFCPHNNQTFFSIENHCKTACEQIRTDYSPFRMSYLLFLFKNAGVLLFDGNQLSFSIIGIRFCRFYRITRELKKIQ